MGNAVLPLKLENGVCLTRSTDCNGSECGSARRQPFKRPPSESSRATVQSPKRTSRLARTPRLSLPLEAQKLDAYDLIVGFLSSLTTEGYIADEDCKVLLGAVDIIRKDASSPKEGVSNSSQHRRTSTGRRISGQIGAQVHGYGHWVSHEGGPAFKSDEGEKIRGDVEDQSFADPKVTKMLQSGVDCKAVLHDRAFNCHTRGNIQEDACIIAFGFMEPFNHLGYYRMPGAKLNMWLNLVGEQYSDFVHYHNWRHAFDVFQLSYLALTDGGMSEYLAAQDCCAIMIAAVAHDVGHEGQNNAFQLKARTELATIYNDKSPLENMHASLTFEILQNPEANFLELLSIEDFEYIRAKIIDAILATDPAHHFPFVEKLSARLKRGPIWKHGEVDNAEAWKAENKDDRRLLLQGFVHLWDVGNCFRSWNVYSESVSFLEEEFYAQGDAEIELGVPITALMDRNKDRLVASQDFFLGKLVLPLFDLYANFMKQDLASLFRSTLESNKDRWRELVQKHGLKPAKEILALEASYPIEYVTNVALQASQPIDNEANLALEVLQPVGDVEFVAPQAIHPIEKGEGSV